VRELEEEVVLVTGGASGIGAAVAERVGEAGARVGLIDVGDAADVVTKLTARGIDVAAATADISDARAVEAAVAAVTTALGPVTKLVNNAGVWVPNPVPESPLELFDRHIDVNLKGTFYVTHAVLPAMLATGRGNIVNVASVSGTAGRAGDSAYSASKAGVVMLTRTLATELGPKGIRINCLCPGAVETPLTAGLRTPEGEKVIADLMPSHPSPNARFFMPPSDMAEIVLFLLSERSRAMHGAIVAADEGITATM